MREDYYCKRFMKACSLKGQHAKSQGSGFAHVFNNKPPTL